MGRLLRRRFAPPRNDDRIFAVGIDSQGQYYRKRALRSLAHFCDLQEGSVDEKFVS
jgi:hypothetical protein